MTREQFVLRSAPRRLVELYVGAVLETARLSDYGTSAVDQRTERVMKLTGTQITMEDGGRYSRLTGIRYGEAYDRWPRSIHRIIDRGTPPHPVLVKMERVGRKRDVEFTVNWSNPDDLEALLDTIGPRIQSMLMSAGTVVTITPDGKVSVEFGRFGTGTWERVAA